MGSRGEYGGMREAAFRPSHSLQGQRVWSETLWNPPTLGNPMVPGPPSFIQDFLMATAIPGLLPAWKKAVCGATSTFILELIRRLPASLAGVSEKAHG